MAMLGSFCSLGPFKSNTARKAEQARREEAREKNRIGEEVRKIMLMTDREIQSGKQKKRQMKEKRRNQSMGALIHPSTSTSSYIL